MLKGKILAEGKVAPVEAWAGIVLYNTDDIGTVVNQGVSCAGAFPVGVTEGVQTRVTKQLDFVFLLIGKVGDGSVASSLVKGLPGVSQYKSVSA